MPGKAPGIRDQIMGQLMQHESLPTRQDMVAVNRALELGDS